MKDLGEVNSFLGLEISRDIIKKKMIISQKKYIEGLLIKYGMKDCKPCKTPIDANFKPSESTCIQTTLPFRELIGSLQYLCLTSRPDICVAVNVYSKYQEFAEDSHYQGLKRILRYLKGTIDHSLIYECKENSEILCGFADADYANDLDDRKSISGFIFKLFGNTICWSTKKQNTISQSSTEAEFIALNYSMKEGIWLLQLLKEIEINIDMFNIYEDNIPCIKISEEPRLHQRSKHIDIKYMKIREMIEKGTVKVLYLSTDQQIADMMTKPLPLPKFAEHRDNIGLRGSVGENEKSK
jgi:hypothetical protein